jgi:hypothetical protein
MASAQAILSHVIQRKIFFLFTSTAPIIRRMRHIDMESAMRRVAERRIEEAMREGKFDNLPGKGLPVDLDPAPADENARMTWWALRLLKNAGFTPDEVRWRKQIDGLKQELSKATAPDRITALVGAINALVRQVNTLGTNAINLPVAPVDLEAELARAKHKPLSSAR